MKLITNWILKTILNRVLGIKLLSQRLSPFIVTALSARYEFTPPLRVWFAASGFFLNSPDVPGPIPSFYPVYLGYECFCLEWIGSTTHGYCISLLRAQFSQVKLIYILFNTCIPLLIQPYLNYILFSLRHKSSFSMYYIIWNYIHRVIGLDNLGFYR